MSRRAAFAAGALLGLASPALALTNVALKACAANQEQLVSCKQMLTLDSFKYRCNGNNEDDGEECFVHECMVSKDCLEAVVEGEADWAMADPLMLYFMNDATRGTNKQVAPIASEVRDNAVKRGAGTGSGQGSDYYSVALVRAETCRNNTGITLADTKGMQSCHVRYGDLASWAFPIWNLMSSGLSDGDTDIEVLSNFYPGSCAASNGDDRVCTACVHRDRCDLNDPFAGNDGVIECLRTEQGDIAFMDNFNAERADAANTQKEFRLLCANGCEPVSDATRPGCTWGTVRADVAFLRVDNNYAGYLQWVVTNAAADARFGAIFNGTTEGKFFSPSTVRLEQYDEDADEYLGPLKEMLDAFQAVAQQEQADQAAAIADPAPSSPRRSGTPGWAVALLFFAALAVGLVGGLFMRKFTKGSSVDAFYQGDMDVANGGLPNTDPRLREDSSGGDSPLNLGFPEANLPQPPMARR